MLKFLLSNVNYHKKRLEAYEQRFDEIGVDFEELTQEV
jgi:hypothetical protein